MSTKLPTSNAAQAKVCEQLRNQPIFTEQIRRCAILDRPARANVHKRMRESLQAVTELQNKYVDMNEFKRTCCLDIDKAFPLIKSTNMSSAKKDTGPTAAATHGPGNSKKDVLSGEEAHHLDNQSEEDDNIGEEDEQRQAMINVNQRKRRRLRNSFFSAENLKTWEENPKHKEYEDIRPGNIYWFKQILYDFENRDRKYVMNNMRTLIKSEVEPSGLGVSKSRSNIGGKLGPGDQL